MMSKLVQRIDSVRGWLIGIAVNAVIIGYFTYALVAPASIVKSSLLPGETTHGHYQIELDCNACHQPEADSSAHTSANVMQDACNRCHAEQLSLAKDTHPATKFNDPTNADLLSVLDAQNCLACHREHVPDQTLTSGLTMPADYCWHCHQEVAETRTSHAGMEFDSCATAGCHNYHDNRALYEKFLNDHYGEEDVFSVARQPSRNFKQSWAEDHDTDQLSSSDADAPESVAHDDQVIQDWSSTAHAAAGVNCTHCHQTSGVDSKKDGDDKEPVWSDDVALSTCGTCHERQTESFVNGKHGMRLSRELSPMRPELARLDMHVDAAHQELTCNACHSGHRFDTQYAAVEACQKCHADSHTVAYSDSAHAELWRKEQAGELPAGSGVTCATCHLPRMKDRSEIWVTHDQNANLRPNETMAREVCSHCHGLEFSLSSLADPSSIANCFDSPPAVRTSSVRMANEWFKQREEARQLRLKNRN